MLQHTHTPFDFYKPWPYTNNALEELLKGRPIDGGGKAIGLALCDELIKYFRCNQFTMTVPSWTILSKENFLNLVESSDNSLRGNIIRSSAADEDWLNCQSGCHKSFPIVSLIDYLCVDKNQVSSEFYVKQTLKTGYGLVVDVAYSKLADNTLVKIASGLKRFIAEDVNRPYYTSATADSEASVKLYNISDATIVCQSLCEYRESALELMDDQSWGQFSTSLCKALKALNFDFPMQLEFIIDPLTPNEIFLVQLRPSPVANIIQEPLQQIQSNVYFESAVFNRPGTTCFQNFKVIKEVDYSRYLFESSFDREDPIAILDPRRIPFWEMNACSAAQAYAWLANYGFKTIITPFALDPAFKHDKLVDEHSSKLSEAIKRDCLIVSLSKSDIVNILEATDMRECQIAVQADEMLARIHLQKN